MGHQEESQTQQEKSQPEPGVSGHQGEGGGLDIWQEAARQTSEKTCPGLRSSSAHLTLHTASNLILPAVITTVESVSAISL